MKKILILLVATLVSSLVHAQTPQPISLPKGANMNLSGGSPEACPDQAAGTFVLGQTGVNTQSNDLTLDTIFLCVGDSIFINHNGNFNLTGDPDATTTPGVGYAVYDCPPTVTGPTLQNFVGSGVLGLPGDPCFLAFPNTVTPVIVPATPNGDTWFFNRPDLFSFPDSFNMGSPYLVHFAPITVDDVVTNGFETNSPAVAPGPCVNINTAASFEVVYLTAISADGQNTSQYDNDCIGRFRIRGGYPQYNPGELYTVRIFLKSNPSVTAIIHTPDVLMSHPVNVIFSVPQSGIYVIEIEDGKSCGHTFEMNMAACAPTVDNVTFDFADDLEGNPGDTICVPMTVANFNNIAGFSTSISWDPTILELPATGVLQDINPALGINDPTSVLNVSQLNEGRLGIAYAGGGVNLPAGATAFSLCFRIITQLDSVCSPITFSSNPTATGISNANGDQFGLLGNNGQVCALFDTVSAVVVQNTISCNGLSVPVSITASGGEAPYELIWTRVNPAGPSSTASNILANTPFNTPALSPGTYRLIVTPENGLGIEEADTSFFDVVTVAIGAQLDLSELPSCNGDNDGEVSVQVLLNTTIQNDLTGFTFNWAPASVPSPTAPVQTGVSAGTYTVTVTQTSSGCTAIAAGSLPNPSLINDGVINVNPASCTGIEDGSFEYNILGGTPFNPGPSGIGQYDFVVKVSQTPNDPNADDFITGTGNPILSGPAAPGFYSITITDANGCTFTDEIEVTALRTVTLAETSITSTSCFGLCDGTAAVSVTVTPPPPGGGNFTFSWLPGPTGLVNSTALTSSITGACGGAYFVAAVDGNGCSDTLTLVVPEPDSLIVNPLFVVNPTCTNETSGSISVLATGGTGNPANFSYNWSVPPGGTNPNITSLSAGTYTVTATDVNGCTAVLDTTLTLPPPPSITVTQVAIKCGNDGSLTATGPVGSFYSWSSPTGNILPNPNEQTISGLSAGTYVILVRDPLNCVNRDTIDLMGVDPMSFSDTTITNPSCAEYTDGAIAIGIAGGNPNYTYTWSAPGGPFGAVLTPVGAGTYNVTVRDAQQCTLTGTFTLVDPPAIQVIPFGVAPTSCFGSCDGEATLIITYLPGSNFSFVWDDGGASDSIRTDLCSGITNVTITESSASQCFVEFEMNIPSPPAISADTMETLLVNATCNGDDDGSVTVSPQGGNGAPYTYNWAIGGTTPTINNLEAGNYAVTISDNDGCTGTYTAVIEEPDPIIVPIQVSTEIACFGEETGELTAEPTGGNLNPQGQPQYSYSWSDGTDIIGNTNPLEMIGAGNYTVTVTDTKNCTGSNTIQVNDPPAVNGQYELGDPLQCFGDETTLTVTNVSGGAGSPYTYTIDNGVPLDTSFVSSIDGGPHLVTFIDRLGCEFTEEFDVFEPSKVEVVFTPPSIEIQLGETFNLNPSFLGVNPDSIESFVWSPADFVDRPDSLSPTLITYQSGTLTLTVTDQNGCTGTGSMLVQVDANRNIYIPNIFFPGNNTGLNDVFLIGAGVGVEKVNFMRVFDRWGELLYVRDNFLPSDLDLQSGWDGRFRGKFVDPGVYVYAIEVLFLDGKKLLYRGDVTVVR
jgi:CHU_C Type IX secretion signal domain/SprB repeat